MAEHRAKREQLKTNELMACVGCLLSATDVRTLLYNIVERLRQFMGAEYALLLQVLPGKKVRERQRIEK